MHADQVDLTVDVVEALVAEQFPWWAGLCAQPVPSDGTVNALFRLGDDVVLRFPLQLRGDAEPLLREQASARLVAAHTRLEVPEPLGLGRPADGYAGYWTAYRWITGTPATPDNLGDPDRFAVDLAGAVGELRAIDTGGRSWDGHSRGGPLSGRADGVARALAECGRLLDVPAVTRVWERCVGLESRRTDDVWIHGDLMPGNLLVRGGRLAAIIDLETFSVGDAAVDLMPAWNLLPPGPRSTFRRALAVDAETWERGRGWAIVQAAVALPYYVVSNPAMADTARRTLAAVLEP